MKLRTAAAVAFVVIAGFGFTWFEPRQQEKKQDSQPEPAGTSTVNRSETSSAMETALEEAAAAPEDSVTSPSAQPRPSDSYSGASTAVRQVQNLSQVQTVNVPEVTQLPASGTPSPVSLPVAQQNISPLKDLEVVKIQKQINEIIKANEKFKSLQQTQTEQIRQITEQAQMHRRMLQDLEEKNREPQELKVSDVDEILRQEKMRIIENETEKNKLLLDQIASQQGGAETGN